MSVLARPIDNQQSMLFDKDARTLYIIKNGKPCKSVEEAEAMVTSGDATKFEKNQLISLQSAFANIVLLGGTET